MGPFLYPLLWEIEKRWGNEYKISWSKGLWKDPLLVDCKDWGIKSGTKFSFMTLNMTRIFIWLSDLLNSDSFMPREHLTIFPLAMLHNANKTWFESSRIQSGSISGRSHLRLCQTTCKVLLSADVLAPAGLAWSDFRPGLTCQLLSASPLVHWPGACHWWAACRPV